MATIANLAVAVSADTGGLTQGLAAAKDHITTFGHGIASSVLQASVALVGFGTAAALAGAALQDAIGDQKSAAQIGILIGDLEVAKSLVDSLSNTALKLSVDSGEMVEAGTTLIKFGVSTGEVTGLLGELANISAATGTSIGELAQTFGQAAIQGGVTGKTIKKLGMEAPMVLAELQKMTGKTGEAFKELATTGAVDMDMLRQALHNVAGKNGTFGHATEGMANTLAGALKNAKDSIIELASSAADKGGLVLGFLWHAANGAAMVAKWLKGVEDAPVVDMKSKVTFPGKEEEEKLANVKKAVDSITESLQKQYDALRLTKTELARQQVKDAGGSSQDQAKAELTARLIQEQEEGNRALEKAKAFVESIRSEEEKYADAVAAANDAVNKGLLTDSKRVKYLDEMKQKIYANTEAGKAEAKAAEDALKAKEARDKAWQEADMPQQMRVDVGGMMGQQQRGPQFAGAALAGSKEAYSQIISDIAKGQNQEDPAKRLENYVKKQVEKQQEQIRLQREANDILKKMGFAVAEV